jgi:prephenate dehydratase
MSEIARTLKVAIQGELGSNSHMATLAMLNGRDIHIVACPTSNEVFDQVVTAVVDGAVLPIENSLHGSVAEHYELLLSQPVKIAAESMLRVRHNIIARPGTRLGELRRVMSHPVALSQCRRWLGEHPEIEAVNFYDTAGSVKYLIAAELRDAGGIAPALAAQQYGAEVLVEGIEDHAENYTRFHLLVREDRVGPGSLGSVTGPEIAGGGANKASLAFSVVHQPGTLVRALEEFANAGVNLTKIESRPVHGTPWEYVFFVDLRFDSEDQINAAIAAVELHCRMFKELGRYGAA